jgi:hypothetical protein
MNAHSIIEHRVSRRNCSPGARARETARSDIGAQRASIRIVMRDGRLDRQREGFFRERPARMTGEVAILNAYTATLSKLRSVNPSVPLLITQITPLNPSGCSACPSRVTTLNSMIPGASAHFFSRSRQRSRLTHAAPLRDVARS